MTSTNATATATVYHRQEHCSELCHAALSRMLRRNHHHQHVQVSQLGARSQCGSAE